MLKKTSKKRNYANFSEEDIQLVRYSFVRLGKKHKVSSSYVGLIANGKREINTQLAKDIVKSIEQMITVCKPMPNNLK